MAYSISKSEIITYKAEELLTFHVIMYEWIDNLNFTLDPKECISNYNPYIENAKKKFLEAGWYGDGDVELMWIPPFMFKRTNSVEFTKGITVWHVKQKEDGLSWILSPVKLPY